MNEILKYLENYLVEGKKTDTYFSEMATQVIYKVAEDETFLNDLKFLDNESESFIKEIISKPCKRIEDLPIQPYEKVSKESYEKQFHGVKLLKKHYKMES